MNIYAVISEFNPFHNGHAHLCGELKRRDPDAAIVAVMSGDFTQRGEVAVIDKYSRAEMAVLGGVDLVLELPAPWCFSGAEFFALGGVSVAEGIGAVDTLAFGSESGDAAELELTASRILSEPFANECKRLRELDKRANTAEIRAAAYNNLFGVTDVFCGSNNLLALEYIKALRNIRSHIGVETVKRVGRDFNSPELAGICSASAIRGGIGRGITGFENFIPDAAHAILRREIGAGRVYGMEPLEKAIFAKFIVEEPKELSEFMEVDEGIAYRICNAAVGSASLTELVDKAKTRRFSASRIRRAILACLLKVHMSDAEQRPLFTAVLAANGRGREILSQMRKKANIAVLSKYSDEKKLSEAATAQYMLHRKAERVAALCCLGKPEKKGAVMI